MIIDKNVFNDQLTLIHTIVNKYQFPDLEQTYDAQLSLIQNEIKHYAFKILVVGIFSSGKTALLNRMLQRDEPLLTESLSPETTIATEIRFDIRNYIEGVRLDDTSVEFSLDQVSAIPLQDYKYIVYHLDNDFLRKYADFTFVDMPGIDSNLENHNKAITQYITQGSAYILLVSAKEGGIRQSLVDFINELNYYPQSLSCFVSMSDVILPSELDTVVNKIRTDLNAIFKEDVNVLPISSRPGEDNDFQSKIETTLRQFNPQNIFEVRFQQKITNFILLLISSIQTYRNSLCLDVSAIEERISDHSQAKKELEFELQRKEREMEYSCSTLLKQILSDLETSLFNEIDNLASAALSGKQALQSALCSTIRPLLIELTQHHSEIHYQELLSSLDLSMLNECLSSEQNSEIDSSLQKVGNILQDFLNGVKNVRGQEISNASIFSIIAGVAAISTSVLNPIIELIIVFMPQILKGLFGVSQEQLEMQKREKIKEVLSSTILPQIINDLSPHLEKALHQQQVEVLEQVKAKFAALINAQVSALEKAKLEIAEHTAEHQKTLQDIDQDLATLQHCMDVLNQFNTTLYKG